LVDLQRRAADYARRDGRLAEDELFYAEQNARLVKNAEAYYRSMFLEEVSSWNLRDRHMAETLDALVTHLGRTVTAASDWGEPAERKRARPALAGSYEALFHATGRARFLLILNESDMVAEQLRTPRLERAIGVIYRPETERQSHYFHARLSDQFDAVLHFDETRAVQPLESTAEWEAGEVPETFRSQYRRKHLDNDG
jgi:erythromycin esterase-like protein